MNAIAFHGAMATQFDRRYERSRAFRERFHVWTTLFGRYVKPGDQVMDMGCGSGIFSQYLAEQGCMVTGIDGSPEMIGLCQQKRTSGNVRYVVQTLPFEKGINHPSQDVIIASSLLEYLDDMPRMLQQMRALLRPGGTLIISVPNKRCSYRRIERLAFMTIGWPRYFAHIRNVSSEATLNQQLISLEFAVLETAYFSGHDPVSRLLKHWLPKPYVNNLLVGVYRKKHE